MKVYSFVFVLNSVQRCFCILNTKIKQLSLSLILLNIIRNNSGNLLIPYSFNHKKHAAFIKKLCFYIKNQLMHYLYIEMCYEPK